MIEFSWSSLTPWSSARPVNQLVDVEREASFLEIEDNAQSNLHPSLRDFGLRSTPIKYLGKFPSLKTYRNLYYHIDSDNISLISQDQIWTHLYLGNTINLDEFTKEVSHVTRVLLIPFLLLCLLSAPAWAQPQPDNTAVGKWTVQTVTDVVTFGVNDFYKKKEDSRKYFTAHGYEKFYEAMESARIPEMVMQTGQSVSLQVTCRPKVTGPTEKDGANTWTVEMPATMVFQKGDKTEKMAEELRVLVRQDKDAGNSDGLGIDQYVATMPDLPHTGCEKMDGSTEEHKDAPSPEHN